MARVPLGKGPGRKVGSKTAPPAGCVRICGATESGVLAVGRRLTRWGQPSTWGRRPLEAGSPGPRQCGSPWSPRRTRCHLQAAGLQEDTSPSACLWHHPRADFLLTSGQGRYLTTGLSKGLVPHRLSHRKSVPPSVESSTEPASSEILNSRGAGCAGR